jgi:hypothetical protein
MTALLQHVSDGAPLVCEMVHDALVVKGDDFGNVLDLFSGFEDRLLIVHAAALAEPGMTDIGEEDLQNRVHEKLLDPGFQYFSSGNLLFCYHRRCAVWYEGLVKIRIKAKEAYMRGLATGRSFLASYTAKTLNKTSLPGPSAQRPLFTEMAAPMLSVSHRVIVE